MCRFRTLWADPSGWPNRRRPLLSVKHHPVTLAPVSKASRSNGPRSNGPVTQVATPERLPPFWDKSVVFFANLLALFFGNEDETAALAKEVGDLESYGGRLIPVLDILYSGGQNCLYLEREPDAALCRYFGETLGLRLPERRLMRHSTYEELGVRLQQRDVQRVDEILSVLGDRRESLVDGYVTDSTLSAIAEHLKARTASTQTGSHRGNNKWLLHQHIESVGLPVPLTESASAISDLAGCLQRLKSEGFRNAVLKSQIGASGIGIQKLAVDQTDFSAVPEMFFFEGDCMVQGWLEPGRHDIVAIKSPSVQLFLDPERVCLYDITEQILSDESIHQGNESPPPYMPVDGELRAELLRQAEVAARWLHEQGYRGTASVDFLVVEKRDSESEVYVCEINARVTGATYPSVLARHFHPGCTWLMRNLKFIEPLEGQHLIDLLAGADHLFTPDHEAGVLPVNFNLDRVGRVIKGQFLCIANSSDDCHRYLSLGEHDLPIDWDYVRD